MSRIFLIVYCLYFQMVVPKRAAMLLDRIMVALHHALEDGDREGVKKISDLYQSSRQPSRNGHVGADVIKQFRSRTADKNLIYKI